MSSLIKNMNNTTPKNRDIQRQNKASTLVTAVQYSNQVNHGISHMEDIINDAMSKNDLESLKQSLAAIQKINTIIKESNTIAIDKYCRSSTFVKKGAISIAQRECRIINESMRTKESFSLSTELRHYNKNLVETYQSIHSIKSSLCAEKSLNLSSTTTVASEKLHTSTTVNSSPHVKVPPPKKNAKT